MYDSTKDTMDHRALVQQLLEEVIQALRTRASEHDLSKLSGEEKETFDRVTPLLKACTYGSPEYAAQLREMGGALSHHYSTNRHHPEYFGSCGINMMNIVDLIEMLADWMAATARMKNGSLSKSMFVNAKRFGIPRDILGLLLRTAIYLRWMPSCMSETRADPTVDIGKHQGQPLNTYCAAANRLGNTDPLHTVVIEEALLELWEVAFQAGRKNVIGDISPDDKG